MQTDVRPFRGDPAEFFRAGILAFAEHPRDDELADWEPLFEADRATAAYDGERIVGTAGIFSFELTVPGGVLPAAGVTIVGVHPTHRRRGILRRMMRAQLDGIHERGEPLAILWASEGSIYQRFGYGLGSLRAGIDVPRHRNAFRLPHEPAGPVRFVDIDEAKRLFPPIFEATRLQRAGTFARSEAYWTHDFFADPEHWRKGASAAFHVVHETDGVPDGYARYRVKEESDAGQGSALQLVELVATNPATHRDLWRFLLDIDLIGHVDAWNVPMDDPITLLVAEPRRLKATFGDGLWVRVVDVAAALAGRRYGSDGRVVLEVDDEFCSWNAGRWSLSIEQGIPLVERTTDAPDLHADITDLGAVYLGAFGFTQLADAARVRELQPGALSRADALFRTDRAPFCPRVF